MVSAAEQRILNWLDRYADSLEQAWDVPRELSLPGIAEGTGVVRSALHKPLKKLVEQGLVIIRSAHVLGGGGRKRSVHHITPKGRELVSTPEQPDSGKAGEIFGDAPILTRAIGRDKDIQAISTADSQVVWVSGMPGIGKTTLLRQIAETAIEDGEIVRWCSANSMMGAAAVVETWLELKSLPHDIRTLSQWVSSLTENNLLIIDDFHLMASRHRVEISKLLESASTGGRRFIISFRPPLEVPEQNSLTIEGLPYEYAIELLEGFDDAKARLIVEHLDGHPLALAMVSDDLSLETAREGLEAFLEKEILAPLPENGRNAVDELAIQPEPVEAGSLAYQNELGTLDEHALLHNLEPPMVGLQQLIRNLRLEQLTLEQRKEAHMKAAKRLSSQHFPRADIRSFYHRIMGADEELDEWMKIHGNQLVRRHPASFTALFDNIHPSESSLNWFMALAECELGEPKRSADFLTAALEKGEVEETPEVITLRSRIHMLSDRSEAAEECRLEAIVASQGVTRVKLIVAEASRKLDDRLPKQPVAHDCIELLESIELSGLDVTEKQDALMAIACIKHAYHLLLGDFEAAAVIRADISEANPSSSLTDELEWRASTAEGREHPLVIDEPLRRLGQIAWSLEYSNGEDKSDLLESMQSLLQQHSQVLERPAGRRAEALGWTWKGIIDESVRTPAWSQAIHIWRSAECPRASCALEERLHSWLTDTGRT